MLTPLDWRRRLLGAYLAWHFTQLLPFAAELFSSAGMLPDAWTSPLMRAFPNVLGVSDGPVFVVALVATGALAGLALALGRAPRVAAAVAFFVLACLFGRNPLIRNPSLPYVGLLLLAVVSSRGAHVSREVRRVLWILLAVGYAYSGLTKLAAPSWSDGTALAAILVNPLAYPHASALLAIPSFLLAALTYATLSLELAFPLLALHRRTRPWAWLAMTGLHLGLLVLIDFADLTIGMLLAHAFVYDDAWRLRLRRFQRRHRAPHLERDPSEHLVVGQLAANEEGAVHHHPNRRAKLQSRLDLPEHLERGRDRVPGTELLC